MLDFRRLGDLKAFALMLIAQELWRALIIGFFAAPWFTASVIMPMPLIFPRHYFVTVWCSLAIGPLSSSLMPLWRRHSFLGLLSSYCFPFSLLSTRRRRKGKTAMRLVISIFSDFHCFSQYQFLISAQLYLRKVMLYNNIWAAMLTILYETKNIEYAPGSRRLETDDEWAHTSKCTGIMKEPRDWYHYWLRGKCSSYIA